MMASASRRRENHTNVKLHQERREYTKLYGLDTWASDVKPDMLTSKKS
jgi:hypothetical protein